MILVEKSCMRGTKECFQGMLVLALFSFHNPYYGPSLVLIKCLALVRNLKSLVKMESVSDCLQANLSKFKSKVFVHNSSVIVVYVCVCVLA